MKIYIDGHLYPREEARISVFDHGLLYGDGVFEGSASTAAACSGSTRISPASSRRRRRSASRIPMRSRRRSPTRCATTVRANQQENGYIRLVVTRGDGPLGLDPTTCAAAARHHHRRRHRGVPRRRCYDAGMRVVTAATRQVPAASVDPRIKSLNYLKNVLARLEAHAAGAAEALMLNTEGFVAECTADNVFAVRGRHRRTPPATEGALDGITRAVVRELVETAGLGWREERLGRYDLFTADECFLTGTGAELVPVVSLDGRAIGSGRPGAVTRQLASGLRALAEREGSPVF